MKLKFILLAIIVFCISIQAYSQTDTLPYLKDKKMPALVFLNMDSTEFNTYNIKKGKKSVLIYFSPDCDHCQMLTKEIIANLDSLKKAKIYMISPIGLNITREFDKEYKVSQQKNMHIYKDEQHSFVSYYGLKFFPFVVVYDEKKNLIKALEGAAKIEDLIQIVKE